MSHHSAGFDFVLLETMCCFDVSGVWNGGWCDESFG